MRLNWRRGSNRLFLLATLAWGAYVLLIGPAYLGRRATRTFQRGVKSCLDTSLVSQPGFSSPGCIDSFTKEWQESLHGTSPVDSLRDGTDAMSLALGVLTGEPLGGRAPRGGRVSWIGVSIVLGLLVLPPAAAYGLFRLGWAVALWVARGFRSPA